MMPENWLELTCWVVAIGWLVYIDLKWSGK